MSHRSSINQRRTLSHANRPNQQPIKHVKSFSNRNQHISAVQQRQLISDNYAAVAAPVSQRKYRHIGFKEGRHSFSDDSDSRRLRYIDVEQLSRNRQLLQQHRSISEEDLRSVSLTHYKFDDDDDDDVYDECFDRIYQEIEIPQQIRENTPQQMVVRMLQTNQLDRPQSSMNSSVTNAVIIHACGGKCKTVESVCYFFLKLMLILSLLTGICLCIAGYILTNAATRDCHVLIYIGYLITFVSGLLLYVQYRAKCKAQQRICKRQMTRRKIIPMDTLNVRINPMHNVVNKPAESYVRFQENQRVSQLPQVQISTVKHLPYKPSRSIQTVDQRTRLDQSGIPWWRCQNV